MSTLDVKEINQAYFNACNFETLLRGIHFVIFWIALSKIFTDTKRSLKSRRIMTILVVVMFILSTVDNASYWAYTRRAFIERGQTSQSIADALNEYPDWFIGLTTVTDANAILADGIIIWRCWIIWGYSWKIIILPVICTLMTTAFSVVALYNTMASTSFLSSGVDFATALYSTSLVTTVYCTFVIVYRLVTIGRRRNGPDLRSYQGVIEILVESSALYCTATLFALIAYVHGGPASEYASAFWTAVTGIAPTLIMARVASGSARPDYSWSRDETSRRMSLPRFAGQNRLSQVQHVGNLTTGSTTVWSDTETRSSGYQPSGKKVEMFEGGVCE